MAIRYLEYLTRSIFEGQKKSVAEWNTLIRMALSEIDELIRGSNVSSSVTTYSFEEYRRELERLATSRGVDIPPQAKQPVAAERNSASRSTRGKAKS